MRQLIPALMITVCLHVAASVAHALPPVHFWSQRFGSADSDAGFSVAIDGSGNVVVTGQFRGTVDFGGGPLTSAGGSFDSDIFVAKYDASGVHQWSQRFGSTGDDLGRSVAVDGSGNVVVTGSFEGTVDFGGGALTSAGFDDIFVARYDASGGHQWSQRFGSTGGDEGGISVAIDGSGNVVVTGQFRGTVDFGGGALTSAGSNDIFVAKYSAAGVHQWSQRFGSTGLDSGLSVAIDGSGNVFVTGSFHGTVNFGGGTFTSAGFWDIFVAKYSAGGVHQWSQRFGSTGSDGGYAVAVDGSANVFVTGRFMDTVDFGGGALTSVGFWDIFVAKYSAVGAHQWSQRFGSADDDEGLSVAADGSGNVVVTGFFEGTVDFGGGALTSAGFWDIFVAKYSAAGVHQWSQRFGSAGSDGGSSVATDGSGNVVVTGLFLDTVDFGGGPLTSAGGNDIFVAKYGGNAAGPLITSITDIGNDQGRQVKIRFLRSGYDAAGSPKPVVAYEAYRRDDPPPPPAAAWHDPVDLSTHGPLAEGWTQVGSVAAHGQTSYGIDVPTIGDSTIAAGQYYSVFFIRAATGNPLTFYDSPVDSGYSLDNLAPGVPTGFAYAAGALSWDESSAADFDYFTVYGANTNSFAAATVVGYTVSPGMDVSASPYPFYFVTATDFSGNEGGPAVLETVTGVGGTPTRYVLSVASHPNPFNPSTTVSYTVPTSGVVMLAIYDARGGKVATLVGGEERGPGAYTKIWDGRSDRGELVPSGVYFARIEQHGAVRSKKMLLLK